VFPASFRRALPAVLAVAAVIAGVLVSLPSAADATATPAPATVGLLGPTSGQLDSMVGSKITVVSLSSGWAQVEPQANVYDTSALSQLSAQLTALRSAGFTVTLDLGLQYPPAWAFSLPGATRFVDQYGDVWHGSVSEDVPNAVFDPSVRTAEANYIAHLAAALGPANLASVRVGGLLSGELRYPPNTDNGHQDLLWDYDSTAQADAPVKGWKPGSGTAAQIQSSLSYYFASLTGYETWLMKTVNHAFPGVNQQVMLPGWGLRPGMVTAAVNAGLRNTTNAEVNGMISSGLDWANQVKAIRDAGVKGTVYTTWLDAPAQDTTVQGEAPVDYLAGLATQYGLPIAGENAGGGGQHALALCVQRVQADHLTAMMYMSGGLIDNGTAGISLTDLNAAANYLLTPSA
jgi:hypothetical protein